MGATILPWWDDWWSVKPNEFERGVITGMLLKCGKSDEPEPTKPEGAVGDWYVEYLFNGGAKIETWVTYDGIVNGYHQIFLNQRKTYSDGTVDEWKYDLSTYQSYGWNFVFSDPDEYGNIKNGTFHWYDQKNSYKINVDFKWYIPTTDPTVVI